MASTIDSKNPKNLSDSTGADGEEGLSSDEIEKILREKDPEFLNEINAMKGDKSLGLAEIDFDLEYSGSRFKGFFKILFNFKKLFYLVSYYLRFFYFWTLASIKKQAKSTREFSNISMERHSKLSKRSKIVFWSLITTTLICFAGVGFLLKTHFLFTTEKYFVSSMEELSKKRYDTNEATEREPFFENIRATPNVFLIQKSVVNLKPTAASTENPMVAFDLVVEGYTAEVINELKVREGHYRDLIHVLTSKYTYDEISTPEGKRDLAASILTMLNKTVKRGQVKSVKFRTIIFKN